MHLAVIKLWLIKGTQLHPNTWLVMLAAARTANAHAEIEDEERRGSWKPDPKPKGIPKLGDFANTCD